MMLLFDSRLGYLLKHFRKTSFELLLIVFLFFLNVVPGRTKNTQRLIKKDESIKVWYAVLQKKYFAAHTLL